MNPIGSTILAVLLVVAVAFVSRFGPALGSRLPGEDRQWHAVTYYCSTGLALGSGFVLLHPEGLGTEIAETVVYGDTSSVAALVSAIGATAIAMLALAVRNHIWQSNAFPGERGHVRAPDSVATRRVWASVGVAVLLSTFLIGLLRRNALAIGPYWIVAIPVGTYFLYNLAVLPVQPPYNHEFESVRLPTDAERDRIATCFERFERSPGSVIVTSGDDTRWAVLGAGRFAGRHLWIEEVTLSDTSDDVLTAALAIHDERGRRGYFSALLVPLAVLNASLVVAAGRFVETWNPWAAVPWMVAPLAIVAIGLWLAGRISSHAESVAADAVGPDAVRRAYEEFGGELTVVDVDAIGRLPFPRWLNPETPTAWDVLRIPDKPERPRSPPPEGLHWPIVGSSLFVPLLLPLGELVLRAAHAAGLLGSAQLGDLVTQLVDLFVPALLVTPLLAVYGLYRQRTAAGPDEWEPHIAYFALAVPGISPFVALVYLLERIYRSDWLWRPVESATAT